jgi:hypothetical protein
LSGLLALFEKIYYGDPIFTVISNNGEHTDPEMAEKIEEVFGFLVLFWRSWLQRDNMTYYYCNVFKL